MRLPYNLFCWRDDQPRPAGEETETAKWRDCTKPAKICQGHYVQTAAKKKNAGKEQPPRAAIRCAVKRKHKQRDRVNEMIEHRLVPDVHHSAQFEGRF